MPESDPRWKQIDQKLPDNDHARVIERQVSRLDCSTLDCCTKDSARTSTNPLALLKIVLYEYLKGRRSPATWEEEARINEAAQWLGRGYTPARRTWYDFRDRLAGVIEILHQQVVDQGTEQKHLDPTMAAQDGTSIAACASRHRMVNQRTL